MNSYKNTKGRLLSDSKGIGVIAGNGENFDSLLRRFKRTISKAGVIKEVHQRRFHEKDSVKRNRKKSESIKRSKQERENEK